MAQLTRAQLAAELEALRVAYERLSAEHAALKEQRKVARPVRVTATATTPYQQALLAAREQAMRSGKVVKVGGAA